MVKVGLKCKSGHVGEADDDGTALVPRFCERTKLIARGKLHDGVCSRVALIWRNAVLASFSKRDTADSAGSSVYDIQMKGASFVVIHTQSIINCEESLLDI